MTYLTENAPRNSVAGKTFRARLQVLRRFIGRNIKCVREGQSIDYETLSKRTGIKLRKLKYWEAGRMEITLAGIIRISAALDVPVSRLFRTRAQLDIAPQSILQDKDREDIDPEDMDPDEASEGVQAASKDIPDTCVPDETGEAEDTEHRCMDGEPEEVSEDTEDTDTDTDTEEADESEDEADPDTPGNVKFDFWHEDLEVQIYKAVKRREKAPEGLPDSSTMLAMEEPLLRVLRASTLFYDLATGVEDEGLHVSGLIFLSQAMKREADRLYRLYNGHHPDYYNAQ